MTLSIIHQFLPIIKKIKYHKAITLENPLQLMLLLLNKKDLVFILKEYMKKLNPLGPNKH